MKRAVSLLLAVLILFSFASCGEKKEENINLTDYKIVTSFYPVYVAVLNITEGAKNVTVTNLINEETGCLHNYMFTKKDLERIKGADLFIASGKDMESFVGNVSLGIPGLAVLDSGEDIQHIIEKNDVENSHYWMNTDNAAEQCEKIKRNLVRLDPQNAEVFENNTAEYVAKLNELKVEAQAVVDALPSKDIVVFHDSFDYFADEFGLNVISAESGDGEEYIKAIEKTGFILVQESLRKDPELKRLVKESGCDVHVIDTVTSAEAGENPKDAYIESFRRNLELLKQILG